MLSLFSPHTRRTRSVFFPSLPLIFIFYFYALLVTDVSAAAASCPAGNAVPRLLIRHHLVRHFPRDGKQMLETRSFKAPLPQFHAVLALPHKFGPSCLCISRAVHVRTSGRDPPPRYVRTAAGACLRSESSWSKEGEADRRINKAPSASHAAARRRRRRARTADTDTARDLLRHPFIWPPRRCPRVLKPINQITSTEQIPKFHSFFFLSFPFVIFFSKLGNLLAAVPCVCLLGASFTAAGAAAAAAGTRVPAASGGHRNRPHPIRRRRKDDPNDAWSGASGQSAHTHTAAPYRLCFPPLERREPTRVSRRITREERKEIPASRGDTKSVWI